MDQEPSYYGLQDLLRKDSDAQRLFSALPDYAREGVCSRAECIHSYQDLNACAGNLTKTVQ